MALDAFANQVKGLFGLGTNEWVDIEAGNWPIRIGDDGDDFSPGRDVTESLDDEPSLVAYFPRV